jgi:hypothetical protein
MKKLLFIYNGEEIHNVNANELDTETISKFKSALAASKGIDTDLIEVLPEEHSQELSDTYVRSSDGALMNHPSHKTYPKYVDCPIPAMDINHEVLFNEFLDLISKGDIDNAIIFS